MANRIVELSGFEIDSQEAVCQVVQNCLYGVDADPLAALLASAELAALAPGQVTEVNIQWADTLLPSVSDYENGFAPPLDLHLWKDVPDGFDIAIGNPPWGRVKPVIRQYLAAAGPTLLDTQGHVLKDRLRSSQSVGDGWDSHAADVRSYSKALRSSGAFQHQGKGDADLYKYFLERVHQLLRSDDARFGLLIPSAFLRSDGCTPLRNLLFSNGSFEKIAEMINSKRYFDIHSMFRFMLAIWQQGSPSRGITDIQFAAKGLADLRIAGAAGTAFPMPLNFIDEVGAGRRTVPDVRSSAQKSLLSHLYKQQPTLGERGCGWSCHFVREIDMSADSRLFHHAHQEQHENDLLPLYEGRMVNQFDSRAKRYVGGEGRKAQWMAQGLGIRPLKPHFLISSEVARKVGVTSARAGFCDITGHANERTVLAALIPAESVAGNKVPTVRFDRDEPALHLVWLAVANSFVIDWAARRRVNTSLNFFQLEQLPFPRIEPGSTLGAEIASAAAQLSKSDERWTPEILISRAALRAQIDARVAQLFNLDLFKMARLLDDFPLLDRHQPAATRAAPSTATRDLVLLTLANHLGESGVTLRDLGLRDRGAQDLAERVATQQAMGQIAYLPGEVACAIQSPSDV
jgi:hypothetical protein